MPANVLIEDPESEWLRLAIPVTLVQDFAPSRETIAFLAATDSAALEAGANQVLRTTVETYRGRMRITATLTDTATQRTENVAKQQAPESGGLIPALNKLAKQFDARAGSFPQTTDRAFQLFTRGVETQDVAARAGLLRQAIEADPHFGLAYVALLNALASAGPAAVDPVLAQAVAQTNSFAPVERARIAALRLHFAHAPLDRQVSADAAVLPYTPNDVDQLTTVASGLYLEGDAHNADRLMQRALLLSAGNAGVRQQYARGLIETRRYRDAEKILITLGNSPSVLADLAFCVLLEGDRARAGSIAEKFFASSPSSDLRTLLRADWFAASGEMPRAIATVQQASFEQSSVRSLAFSQAALWQAYAGDFAASQTLARAAQEGGTPAVALFAQLLSRKPVSPAAWRDEVAGLERDSVNTPSRDLLAAYGLFLFGFYADSVNAWQALVNQSGGADLASRAMLAASLAHAGQTAGGAATKVQPFVPDLQNFYSAIPFIEMRRSLQ
ncbi:MAG: hypothetical protein JO270_13625 [Acidobacteriaceae bacterium]|nr:hypothetical protein [Acidobacteriaceae bacterium]